MSKKVFLLLAPIFAFLILTITNCGSGGGGGSTSGGNTITGTAAAGKALANTPVYLVDSKKNIRNTVTDANGNFSFDTTGLTPPFYLRTQYLNPKGNDYENFYSYLNKQTGTVNITPLTTAVVALANNGNPDIFTPAQNGKPPTLNIENAKNKVKDFVKPVLSKYGVSNADLIETPFKADGTGLDLVMDSIQIVVDTPNKTIEIKNPFTGATMGQLNLTNGQVQVAEPITPDEANSLPQTVKRYYAYVKDNYGFPEYGPAIFDIADDGTGKLSVTITSTEGETGDIFIMYGTGTKNGNSVTINFSAILCTDTNSDVDPYGINSKATFTGTINNDGSITGTFTNTLPTGDTCWQNGSNVYEGTFRAYDVTNAQPANVAGTYDVYVAPTSGIVDPDNPVSFYLPEMGPGTIQISQNGSSINVSLTFTDEAGNKVTKTGTGIVNGNFVVFRIPVIICEDTGTGEPEYATFFGEYKNGTISGVYGDGIYPGDQCKNGNADGKWRAVKK